MTSHSDDDAAHVTTVDESIRTSTARSDWRVEADVLIPGRGEPVRDATLLVSNGRISYAGPRSGAPADEAEVVRAPVVMPGLWDCHVHLLGLSPMAGVQLSRVATEPAATRAARCVGDIQAALAAGVTSVRDLCGLGVHLAEAVDDGSLVGPSIYAAGALLSPTGGHGDLHDLPLPWVSELGQAGGEFRQCDGEAECAKAVREQLRKGAKVIKLSASGGGLSVRDDPRHQQFTVSEMRTIVEIAGIAERVVAAHSHGKAGIMAALEAGVRTIEHGSYLDEEACDAMRESGAILVPTLTVQANLLATPDLPPWVERKARALADQHRAAVRMAHERGVTIAMGSDIFLSRTTGKGGTWGGNGQELSLLAELGLSPLEAIEAATATAPDTLGPQAPNSGMLEAGYDADFLTLQRDPLTDLTALADTTTITGVWKAGRRVKDGSQRPRGRVEKELIR